MMANGPIDRSRGIGLVGATWLVRSPVPLLLFAASLVVFVIFSGHQPTYFVFFLPVAVWGVGGGARSGTVAGGASVGLVALAWLADGGWAILRDGDFDPWAIAVFVAWSASIMLTGFLVGLVSERGGRRGIGRDLGGEIMRAVEREHMRIGFDLHDTLAQDAAASLMEADLLISTLDGQEGVVRDQAHRLRGSISDMVDEIRITIAHLRPPMLSQEEFLETLHELVEGFSRRTGIKTELSVEGHPERHSDSMRICIFRVVQEALTNCETHSRASRALVSIRSTKRMVYLMVSDDGVGFVPSAEDGDDPFARFGLRSMRERVALLGGELEIETAPHRGTGIRAQIPVL